MWPISNRVNKSENKDPVILGVTGRVASERLLLHGLRLTLRDAAESLLD